LDVYRSDEEQIDALRKWWGENGKSAIAGVILGLSAIYGWRGWQDYKIEQAEAASELYQQMVIAIRDDKNVNNAKESANKILTEYESTAYSIFANLTLAKLSVDEKDFDSAAAHLNWALENNSEQSIEHLIRKRLALVLIAQDKLGAALTLLDVKNRGEFAASYDELRGDILHLQDDITGARDAYQLAITKTKSANGNISVLELKMDDLGRKELK